MLAYRDPFAQQDSEAHPVSVLSFRVTDAGSFAVPVACGFPSLGSPAFPVRRRRLTQRAHRDRSNAWRLTRPRSR